MRNRQKRHLMWTLGALLLVLALAACQPEGTEGVQPTAPADEASPTPSGPAPQIATPAPAEAVAGPTPASIAQADDAMVLGDPEAAVTIVEFSDYECPFCAKYNLETFPMVKGELIDTGRVHYVFKDYPLAGLHPRAAQAHVAARCAGDQGAYWDMHARLFERQSEWSRSSDRGDVLESFAADLGLETSSFAACLASGRWDAAVDADVAEGTRLGVRGTPTFFVNGYPLVGAHPFEVIEEVVGLAEEGTLGEAYQPTQ